MAAPPRFASRYVFLVPWQHRTTSKRGCIHWSCNGTKSSFSERSVAWELMNVEMTWWSRQGDESGKAGHGCGANHKQSVAPATKAHCAGLPLWTRDSPMTGTLRQETML